MNLPRLSLIFSRDELHRYIAVYIVGRDDAGKATHLAAPLELHPIPEDLSPPGPTLFMDNDTAQSMMDRLWDIGIRPSEGQGSAGMMAATERHLADMRALAFHALQVPAPVTPRR